MSKESSFLFLSLMIPKEIEEQVRKKSKNNMQDAANALQWHIYDGLCANLSKGIDVINVVPVGSFPQYYSEPFIKKERFSENFLNVGFCNVKLIRKLLLAGSVYRALRSYYKDKSGEKTLLVYTMNSAFLQAITKLKKRVKDISVCAVVADLPDMSSLSSKKSRLNKLFDKFLSKKSYSAADCIDKYVLLTEHMADYMGITKPFCVMEGISTETEAAEPSGDSALKTVLYTGTLHKRFGVTDLVDAFMLTEDRSMRLVICGVGDSEEYIRIAAARDSRIDFRGQVTREEALRLQREATVLVNPRKNNEEFTKYSFPSKNLEYLSSGKPLIAYKLDGIPDEYDGYIYYVKDDSPEGLANALKEVCSMPYEKRRLFGEEARRFVLREKNCVVQTNKILEFIKT